MIDIHISLRFHGKSRLKTDILFIGRKAFETIRRKGVRMISQTVMSTNKY